VAVVAVVFASYAFYLPNEEWYYLRFFLPAYPLLAALGGTAVAELMGRLAGVTRVIVAGVLAYAVLMAGMAAWTRHGILQEWVAESRYETVARFVARELPANAILLASQQSGSLRYYADRPVVRFDLLEPAWFDRALDWLRAHGLRPYIVIEDWEVAAFQKRLQSATRLASLDWPSEAEFAGPVVVRIFDVATAPSSDQRTSSRQSSPAAR
jgi:hypothetical protein